MPHERLCAIQGPSTPTVIWCVKAWSIQQDKAGDQEVNTKKQKMTLQKCLAQESLKLADY